MPRRKPGCPACRKIWDTTCSVNRCRPCSRKGQSKRDLAHRARGEQVVRVVDEADAKAARGDADP